MTGALNRIYFKFESDPNLFSKAKRVLLNPKRVNVDFPAWMVESLDREAGKLGITRQSIIKVWLAERLEDSASNPPQNRSRRIAA